MPMGDLYDTDPKKEERHRGRLFCYFLARLGDPTEAAVRAGYPPRTAAREAARLLGKKTILRLTAHYGRMEQEQKAWGQAVQGLRRLAFGPVNDAIALVCSSPEELPDIASLDLFHIAEIKCTKGGGCEVKFYSRLEALKALVQAAGHGDQEENSLYQALTESAAALSESDAHV